MGVITVATKAEGSVYLYNKNGVELQELVNGENDMSSFTIGVYYLVVKHGVTVTALTPFYCIK